MTDDHLNELLGEYVLAAELPEDVIGERRSLRRSHFPWKLRGAVERATGNKPDSVFLTNTEKGPLLLCLKQGGLALIAVRGDQIETTLLNKLQASVLVTREGLISGDRVEVEINHPLIPGGSLSIETEKPEEVLALLQTAFGD
jgi:hypothetical protein